MSDITLHYFGVYGRGEAVRQILTLGGANFVDHRITFAEWPEIKPTMPGTQVPCLEYNG